MTDFLSSQEKIQLQKVLGKSSQLRTPNERIEFLQFCGLGHYCNLVQIDQPLNKFFISIYNQLSKDYVNNGQKLALVVFLEYLIALDSNLSQEDNEFIQYVISQSYHQPNSKNDSDNAEALPIKNTRQIATTKTSQEDQNQAIKTSNLVPMSKPSQKILHLSDLHFGTSEQAKLWSGQLVEDLQQNLDINQLDALILSGDIANESTPEEYEAAKEFLDEFIKDFPLKPEQIIIVPGNHDLNWKLSEKAYSLKDKDECQPNELQEGCYITVKDDVVRILNPEKYPQRFTNFKAFYDNYKGKIKEYQLDSEQQYSLT